MHIPEVPAHVSFPEEERKVLEFWDKIDAFHTSLRLSEGRKPFSFFDGPPFATGLPHHGHVLTGTVKDVVTRYAHMTGHHVERRFGWDCHGLPVEHEIDKMLGIKSVDDVMKMGIKAYNAECRAIVMKYSAEWEDFVRRIGRWIDFKNDYKTLDTTFMESVWWVFKQLYDKDQVYKGFMIMPYSTGCTTPMSNFEANLNYKDTIDPSVVVSFPLVSDPSVSLLAWTTTPWTLPCNLALCVNPAFEYVKIKDGETGNVWILLESRLDMIYKDPKKAEYAILEKVPGTALKGLKYVPLFDYFLHRKDCFVVVADSYVTNDSGTGIVHQAPAFGEDDFRVCLAHGVVSGQDVPCPLDPSGNFTAEVRDYQGQYIKDAEKQIQKDLKAKGRLLRQSQFSHSYPFCWRSDTPLIYRAVPSWFVRVANIREKLLKCNAETNWVPDFAKEKRFANWLDNARDWNISRNRYWGTPLPLWISEDGEELGRSVRDRTNKPLKTPLRELVFVHPEPAARRAAEELRPYILEELNVKRVMIVADEAAAAARGVRYELRPDHRALGRRLGAASAGVRAALGEMTAAQVSEYVETGRVVRVFDAAAAAGGVGGGAASAQYEAKSLGACLVMLDVTDDPGLVQEGFARELVNRVQRLRKKAGLQPTDDVLCYYEVLVDEKGLFAKTLQTQDEHLKRALKGFVANVRDRKAGAVVIADETQEVDDINFRLVLVKA